MTFITSFQNNIYIGAYSRTVITKFRSKINSQFVLNDSPRIARKTDPYVASSKVRQQIHNPTF